ncbi:ATP-binding cassette domain-containing protein [Exiguobacterium aurantiacum]|uniref:ATP-binding cassette domain-containing protein n=1 Tax=Exiguobacterium aurantiacum TaxID=33987 RepID=A0ABY5FS37_9BACL|nr:ATP-binding cassette domain-containing protein [Exiguobacterium aurantiacum]UTT44190.1 ATP-binding cassette domain-containing protein [Exiguobacterium aurantiacum]
MRWLSLTDGHEVLDDWVRTEQAKIVHLDTPLAGKVASLISEGDALRGAELAALLQIDHLFHKRFDECSSGERQLVRIAYALSKSTEALVLIEPFRHLDRFRSEHLSMLLRRLTNLGVRIAYTDRARERGVADRFLVAKTITSPHLDVNDVSYRHPLQASYAVEHVSYETRGPGLTVCIGTNGSGKSTLLELIAKSVRPLYGKVKWSERPVYLPADQEYGPFPHATNRRFAQLQAVFASEASLLLLDEPTVGLTELERRDFERALSEKAETAHIICATHDEQLIKTADRIICLSNGALVFDGDRSEYMKRSALWSHMSSSS